MSNQGFEIIPRDALTQQLTAIFRHWEASAVERADFIGWAWVVAAASELSASEDRSRAAQQVADERDVLHGQVTDKLLATSIVDLSLVSKRMLLDWLADCLASRRAVA